MQEASSELVSNAVDKFSSLPGIGRKSALRLVLKLLQRDKQEIIDFAKALTNLAENIKFCSKCHNLSDDVLCAICSNQNRNQGVICIVEGVADVMAIESTQQFSGTYHILGGVISPIDGIGPSDLNINALEKRVHENPAEEIIFALNSSVEGDTTQYYLNKKLKAHCTKITTLARGISFGDQLEYADEITLGRSILNRTLFD